MSGIGSVNSLNLQSQIAYKLAAKAQDVAKMEGAAMLSLLEGVADMVEIQGQQIENSVSAPTVRVGRHIDVQA